MSSPNQNNPQGSTPSHQGVVADPVSFDLIVKNALTRAQYENLRNNLVGFFARMDVAYNLNTRVAVIPHSNADQRFCRRCNARLNLKTN